MKSIKELTRKEKEEFDSLFLKYKELAAKIGLINANGNFTYNRKYREEVAEKINLDNEEGEKIRQQVSERYEIETPIYYEMELLMAKMNEIRK